MYSIEVAIVKCHPICGIGTFVYNTPLMPHIGCHRVGRATDERSEEVARASDSERG
jgi:hypothetical protein